MALGSLGSLRARGFALLRFKVRGAFGALQAAALQYSKRFPVFFFDVRLAEDFVK